MINLEIVRKVVKNVKGLHKMNVKVFVSICIVSKFISGLAIAW